MQAFISANKRLSCFFINPFVWVFLFTLASLLFIQPVSADETIQVNARVGDVISGPIVAVEEDTETDSENKKKKSAVLGSQATVSVEPTNEGGALFSNVKGDIQFTTPRPAFKGTTNIQNANISLIFSFGKFSLRATLRAGADGTWQWVSPEDFPNGNFTVKVVATHPTESRITTDTAINFSVASTENTIPWNQQYPDASLPNLFDLSVNIEEQYTNVAPGANVIAAIQMINFNPKGNLINALVDYRILDSSGVEVLRQQETVVIGTKLGFFKTFYTQPDMKPGVYTLVVKTPSQNALAMATAEFTIGGERELQLSPLAKIDYTVIFLAIGAIFFTFIFLSYFEFARFLGIKKRIRMVKAKFFKGFLS